MSTEIDDILSFTPGSGPVPIKYRKKMPHVHIFCPWCTLKIGEVTPGTFQTVILAGEDVVKQHLKSLERDSACNQMKATGKFKFKPSFAENLWTSFGIEFSEE